jgi:alpha-N-acetylglucosaminidase
MRACPERRVDMSKRIIWLALVVFSAQPLLLQAGGADEFGAAGELIRRVAGDRAADFSLRTGLAEEKNDAFRVTSAGGKVTITANSTAGFTRGFYHFLRNACRSQIAWSGEHLDLPRRFPDYDSGRIVSPYGLRLYYNVCTFGYTTAFWDWPRWEREIDWLALHGINAPLAMAGQEAVWQRVWKSLGLTDADLGDYFTGPAFLPWHRMGNINKHDGPLPQSYIDGSFALQQKIVARMKELGMNPVVPAFSGFVPAALKRVRPGARIVDIAPWAGFERGCGTHILPPTSPLFPEIGKRFIQEYRKAFGDFHYYLADSFNELKVPVTPENRFDELAAYGRAVFESIDAGDPGGVWVMQGWIFHNDPAFWDKASARALLSRVPDDRMIIIDLAEEMFQGWKKHDAFYGKPWIYSIIHNFGGHNNLFGDLGFIARDPAAVLGDPGRGRLVGFGLSPEGIENNEVVYELLTDVAWGGVAIDLRDWLRSYCVSRYGACPPAVEEAWTILLGAVYGTFDGGAYAFQLRPPFPAKDVGDEYKKTGEALQLLLGKNDELGARLFRNDLVDVAAYCWGKAVGRLLYQAGVHERSGRTKKRDEAFERACALMLDLDRLLSSREDTKLARWIDLARAWGVDDKEKDYYEADAKRQVTVWGGPELSEYAAKFWGGLVKDYYAARWRNYFESVTSGRPWAMNEWEERWIMTPYRSKGEPIKDLGAFIRSVTRSVD